ncbi:MAG: hypothetical protein ACRC35_07110 [Angustibacter sp.]
MGGCTTERVELTSKPSEAGTAAVTPGTPSRGPASGPNDADAEEDLPELPASPTWDAASRDAAVALARRAMVAYARPSLPAQRWWAGLSPLLSEQARAAYTGTDPREVPVRRVAGTPRLETGTSAYLARVRVATNVGPYQVLLTRRGAGEPWRVERLTPPPGVR